MKILGILTAGLLLFSASAVLSTPRCDQNDLSESYFPVEGNCRLYWACRNGIAVKESCPNNLLFDIARSTCDIPENVDCSEVSPNRRFMSSTSFEHPDCPFENPPEPVILPHKYECGKFYICDKRVAHEKSCLPGLHFNAKLKVCDYPKSAKCSLSPTTTTVQRQPPCDQVDPNKLTFLPHPSNCSQFISCWKGEATFRPCPPRLHFNRGTLLCDYPESAGCDERAGREVVVTESTHSTVKEVVSFETPLCPRYNGKYPVFFRDLTNCSTYYMCNHGRAFKFVCPNFLHFNLEKNACDMPYRAGCREGMNVAVTESTA